MFVSGYGSDRGADVMLRRAQAFHLLPLPTGVSVCGCGALWIKTALRNTCVDILTWEKINYAELFS